MSNNGSSPLVLWYNQLGMNDVDRVGGKNASLGEMVSPQPPTRLTSFWTKAA